MIIWGNSIPGRETPMANASRQSKPECWRNSKESSVAGDKWARERAGGSDVREVMKGQM